MSSKSVVLYKGPGFIPLLTLLFITLKLTEVIDWSWWWILSPMWGTLILIILWVGLYWWASTGGSTHSRDIQDALDKIDRLGKH